MSGGAETVNGACAIEARAHAHAADELRAGEGRGRAVDDLEAERLALAYAAAARVSPADAARIRGRREALAEAIREPGGRPATSRAARDGQRLGFGFCASCKAPVRWLRVGGGKVMPVDVVPTPGGNVVATGPEGCRVLREGETADGPAFRSHFDTCDDPGRFRRKRRR